MKNKMILIFLLVGFSPFYSCELEREENFHFALLNIVGAEVPESFDQFSIYEIPVVIERPDNCTYFQGFDVSVGDGGLREIVAIGSVLQEDDCQSEVTEVTTTMTMEVTYGGPYTLRFYAGEDEEGNPIYKVYEIPVNQN